MRFNAVLCVFGAFIVHFPKKHARIMERKNNLTHAVGILPPVFLL